MSSHYRLRSVSKFAACRITFLAIACALTAPGLAQSYTVTDLGTLGGAYSRAYDINNAGQITGEANLFPFSSIKMAFLWEDGEMINIGNLGDPSNWSMGRGINDRGEIAGSGELPGPSGPHHAFRWQGGRMTDMGTLGGASSHGYAINEFGDIAGNSWSTGTTINHAVMWIGAEIFDLGVLVPGYDTYGRGINNSREVVGWGWVSASDTQGFYWNNGFMYLLPDLGGVDSSAEAINEMGWIAGHSRAATGATHPVVWLIKTSTATPIIDLGVPAPFIFGFSNDVNNLGQVVGEYWPFCDFEDICAHPFVWEDGRTQLLDDLIPPDSGWDLDFALGINDVGQIVGEGVAPNGEHHAFLLTPIGPGDIDLDGDIDVADLLLLLSAWGPCGDCDDCSADLDDNCTVGVSDLLILLTNWS